MIEAYKGFDKFAHGIECRGYIFEEGKTYTQNEPPILCQSGFHACLDPLNVLDYYFPKRAYTRDRFGNMRTVYLYPDYLYPDHKNLRWYTIKYPYGTLYDGTEYHKVYIEGDADIDQNMFTTIIPNTKICTNKIRIGEKINLDDIMQIHLKLLNEFEQECTPWLDATNCSGPEPMNECKITNYCSWLKTKNWNKLQMLTNSSNK